MHGNCKGDQSNDFRIVVCQCILPEERILLFIMTITRLNNETLTGFHKLKNVCSAKLVRPSGREKKAPLKRDIITCFTST
jgi:hypothetical protein